MNSINEKIFLLPDSIKSMAAVHIKIHEDRSQYQIRISDCNDTVKLWGGVDDEQELIDGIEKLSNLAKMSRTLQEELQERLDKMIESKKLF